MWKQAASEQQMCGKEGSLYSCARDLTANRVIKEQKATFTRKHIYFIIFSKYIQHLDCPFMSGGTEGKQQEKSTTEQIPACGTTYTSRQRQSSATLYLVPCNTDLTQIHETVLQWAITGTIRR